MLINKLINSISNKSSSSNQEYVYYKFFESKPNLYSTCSLQMYSILLFIYKKKVIKIELSNTVKTNFVDSMDTKKYILTILQ